MWGRVGERLAKQNSHLNIYAGQTLAELVTKHTSHVNTRDTPAEVKFADMLRSEAYYK